jgi:hypothetical protein
MDDPLLMRLLKGLRGLCPNLQNLINRQRTFLQTLGQRLALQVLHDQESRAVLRADVVKRADMRVLQGGDRFGFPLQALF